MPFAKVSNRLNNFAITSADIGAAMERSAAALKAGGNDIDEALGLITAGNLIQQDAETTANALKVLSLRIRGLHKISLHIKKFICYTLWYRQQLYRLTRYGNL